MKKFLRLFITVWIIFFLFVHTSFAIEEKIDQEPGIKEIEDIVLHQSLGGEFHYKDGSVYVHAPATAPSQEGELREDMLVVLFDHEIKVYFQNGIVRIYQIIPSFWQDPVSGEFIPLIDKTWPPCGCTINE